MLSTGTTSSTNPPTAQVESSRNWGLDTVDQQVTMVHIAWFTFGQGTSNRFPNLDGNHISSDEQDKQQDSMTNPFSDISLKATRTLHKPQTEGAVTTHQVQV